MTSKNEIDYAAQAQKLARYLGRPCTYFPPAASTGPVLEAYEQARARGEREGFVPMLLAAEFVWGMEEQTPQQVREALSAPLEPGKALMHRRLEEWKEEMAEYGEVDWDADVIGAVADGEAINSFLGLWDYGSKQTEAMILAEIPAEHPWEVFAWLPFGGWNECPDNMEQMAAAKYWYEEYGAVPGLMTCDILEYVLPAPVPRERASELAMEQYSFCADIVDQGVGTVGRLADGLAQSDHWYFWWD